MGIHSFRKRSPNDLPPADVRFTEVRIEPWPDGRRVRVHMDMTPFQQNPNLEATITDRAGKEAAHTLIVETAEHRIVFTMHLRGEIGGPYHLTADLSYPEVGIVDSRSISFETLAVDPREIAPE